MSLALIIVIGWLYVTILIAAHEPSIVAGIVSFLFYGALPCGLILYFSGSKVRRQRRAFLAAQCAASAQPDQAGHPSGHTVPPIGKETTTIGNGTVIPSVDSSNAGRL